MLLASSVSKGSALPSWKSVLKRIGPKPNLPWLAFSLLLNFALWPTLCQAAFNALSRQLTLPQILLDSYWTIQLILPLGWAFWFIWLAYTMHKAEFTDLLALYWHGTAKQKWFQLGLLLLMQTLLIGLLTLLQHGLLEAPLVNPLEPLKATPWYGLVLIAVILAPLSEEWVFRGWMQGVLERYYGELPALWLTAIVFTLLHVTYLSHSYALVYVLSLGLLYGMWRLQFQSIWPIVFAHMVNNGASLLLLYGHGSEGK